jgi:hypothetical protein
MTREDDLISRQAVHELVRSLSRWCVRSEDGKLNNVGLLYDDVMFGVDKIPSVKLQEKTGHWIDEQDLGYHVSICSNCNWRGHGDTHLIFKTNYCPNCGARMFESQEREGESDCRDCKVEHDCYECEKYAESEE